MRYDHILHELTYIPTFSEFFHTPTIYIFNLFFFIFIFVGFASIVWEIFSIIRLFLNLDYSSSNNRWTIKDHLAYISSLFCWILGVIIFRLIFLIPEHTLNLLSFAILGAVMLILTPIIWRLAKMKDPHSIKKFIIFLIPLIGILLMTPLITKGIDLFFNTSLGKFGDSVMEWILNYMALVQPFSDSQALICFYFFALISILAIIYLFRDGEIKMALILLFILILFIIYLIFSNQTYLLYKPFIDLYHTIFKILKNISFWAFN